MKLVTSWAGELLSVTPAWWNDWVGFMVKFYVTHRSKFSGFGKNLSEKKSSPPFFTWKKKFQPPYIFLQNMTIMKTTLCIY